ncbi:MAG: hypothetical protein ACO3N9_04875 [Alphaproteobacteria bacterium]
MRQKSAVKKLMLERDRPRRKFTASTFFKRGRNLEYLRSGSTFRSIGTNKSGNNVVETAYVDSVGTDHRGIPHVRFRLAFSSASRPLEFGKDTRLLALDIFTRKYSERVDGPNS